MDQKELLDKIRHSAEGIEIPEQLTPQSVEEKLKREAQQKKIQRRKIMIRWMEAAAVLAIVAAGGTQTELYKQWKEPALSSEADMEKPVAEQDTESSVQPEEVDASGEFKQADSEEELYKTLQELEKQTGSYARGGDVMLLEESAEITTMDAGAADTAANQKVTGEADYSQTNVREAGVDEGDVVKTDGSYLYVLKSSGSVRIVDIRGTKMKEIAEIQPEKLNESIEDLYLDGDRLMLVTTGYESSMEEAESDMYTVNRYQYTALTVYDITEREHPEVTGRITQEGDYRQSRKNGDYVYLLTQYSPSLGDSFEDSSVMPLVNEQKLAISDVYLPDQTSQPDYLVASGINIQDPENVISSKAIVSGAADFYMSSDNLFICNNNWNDGKSSTEILRFACEDGEITAGAMCELPGFLNDTFSLDEYQGYLRVLLTEDSNGESNSLYILDADMQVTGAIRDLADGETIRSARFMGTIAYFVTFRQTDPLFCADLSDPDNPQILSELKLTGFSSYLHPYGDHLLLGVGYEAEEETGSQTGVKLSMFDISEPSQVEELDKYVIKGASYLPSDYDYKAILADGEKNLIGFVCDGEYLVFSYDEEKGFQNLLTYTMSDWEYWDGDASCRGVYAGDEFYIVDQDEVLCFDMNQDFTLTDRLAWN
ncbi:MAG: beta-propeller domain-containing protein [Lachnospiraceae bacterium]|nr:beta-propeller domain-containing protein [Lachnospiraceae bacterium]